MACRGCWMPGANEVLVCLRKYYVFLTTLFLVVHLNFSLFRISCQISLEFAPWMPPVLHHAPVTTLFYFFVGHLPTFSKRKLAPWMPPRMDARGRRTVRTPLCMPLHLSIFGAERLQIMACMTFKHAMILLNHCNANTFSKFPYNFIFFWSWFYCLPPSK